MKYLKFLILGFTILLGSLQASLFPTQAIMDMAARDSEVRQRWIQSRDVEIAKELRFQEIGNTLYLSEIFANFGLPKNPDDDLQEAILRLVLHSSDLEFQKRFLSMIIEQKKNWDEISDVLVDRVLLRENKPQKYGTHLHHQNGELVPYPIEDMEKIDLFRSQVDEPIFAEYLQIMRELDKAIGEKREQSIYKILFNMVHDFYQSPSDYLYFATFHKLENSQKDEMGFLAFEDPALATAFLLFSNTRTKGDISLENDNLIVTISPKNFDEAAILDDTPIYLNLVKKEYFSSHEEYDLAFPNRVFYSKDSVEPLSQFECDSALEALILGGSNIRISGMGDFHDETLKSKILEMLYFDITLENESFSHM